MVPAAPAVERVEEGMLLVFALKTLRIQSWLTTRPSRRTLEETSKVVEVVAGVGGLAEGAGAVAHCIL